MISWSLAAFAVALFIAFTAWALSPRTRHPAMGVFFSVALMAGAYGGAIEVLGQPKPLSLEWRDMEGLEIAGIMPAPSGRTIYVWVIRDGVPVSYSLEAGDGDAKRKVAEILDHWRRRQQTGEQFRMTGNGDDTPGPHMKVTPPPPQPPKDTP